MALTKDDITKLFEDLSTNIIDELKCKLDKDMQHIINGKFAAIFKKIDEIRNTATEALKVAKWSEEQILQAKEENANNLNALAARVDGLVAVNDDLKRNIETHSIKIHVLEKRIED